ncbi:MAG: hypothetical protein JWQ40_1762 [Segetibacter sp.]|nr:hypothetical protein [Segetibacter sp.]
MVQSKSFFMFSPGGENEDGGIPGTNEPEEVIGQEQEAHKKTFSEKVHDALQDWSNDDQADQDFDDTQP